jgi:hypothetical protein
VYFTIAGKRFVVLVSSRQIIRIGIARRAWFDSSGKRILISADVPREERRRELFHELRHGWTENHGLPGDSESDAISVSTFNDAMLEQFEAQGGNAALIELDPPGDSVPTRAAPHITRDRQSCQCGAEVMCGSIASDAPVFNEEIGVFTMPRGMLCPACDRVTVWIETCTPTGTPLGTFLANPQPRMLDGADAAKWIGEHARQIGVVAVDEEMIEV